jgi:hypothetical protein
MGLREITRFDDMFILSLFDQPFSGSNQNLNVAHIMKNNKKSINYFNKNLMQYLQAIKQLH